MKKNISRKRERVEAESQDSLEKDLHDFSEADIVSPVKNLHFEQLIEHPVEQVTFPQYLENFLYKNALMFNDLINLTSPGFLVDYLNANRVCNTYFKALYDALNAVLSLAKSRYPQIVSTSKEAGEEVKSINIRRLIAVLRESTGRAEIDLVRLLTEGIKTWRLPMIANLFQCADDPGKSNIIQALIWLEKRREFIKSSINQDEMLMHWLSDHKQSDMKKILCEFTQSIAELLSKVNKFRFFDEDNEVFQNLQLPEMIDVRKLWYVLYLKDQYSKDDNAINSRDILSYSQCIQKHFNVFSVYDTAFPSPLDCFVDAFNGLQISERHVDCLSVSGDVLIWLLVAQRDNAKLASEINRWSTQVDKVVRAYANHNKQIKKQETSNLLAKSMATTLLAIDNSPTKSRQVELEQLNKLSPAKSLCQEFEVPKESVARKIHF